mmetsp:Transcript_9219/g.16101  ORF Transcript_9219/g.16101 Transcript_9219/m.16101 type:complete len:295 (-) Transcript_9219:211-1095(-)
MQVGLAVISESRRLHRAHLDPTAQLVDHERCQRFGLDILGNNKQLSLRLHHLLQNRNQALHSRNLLLHHQNQRVLKLDLLRFRVRHKVRRYVAPIKLHAFHDLQFIHEQLSVSNRDRTVLTDTFHSICDQFADGSISIGRNGSHRCNLLLARNTPGHILELLQHMVHRLVNSSFEIHRVHARRNCLDSLRIYRAGEYGGGGCTITSDIIRRIGDAADQLCPQVHMPILKLHILGDRNAVLGDLWGSIRFFDDDVSTFWTKCDLHCVSECINTTEHQVTRLDTESQILTGGVRPG